MKVGEQTTLATHGVVETIVCEVCGSDFPKNKSLRLTSWKEPVTEATEWCCLFCANRAFEAGQDE